MNRIGLSLAVIVSALSLRATEYFVATNGVDEAGGGLTEATAFRTIQYAVGKAAQNDTITLLPGDHVEGLTTSSNNGSARVYIFGKPGLVIRSKNGRATRDVTRIVGEWDDDVDEVTPVGMGANAVRCVFVKSDSPGVRLEGLTFYRGSTQYGGSETAIDAVKLHGGGVCFQESIGGTIVDCAFVECQATRGGGVYTDQSQSVAETPVVVSRCLFKNCRGTRFGNAQRGGCAYNCVYDGNGRGVLKSGDTVGTNGALEFVCRVVGCTFVRNASDAIGGNKQLDGGVFNCLFVYNDGAAMAKKATSCAADYCVYEGELNGSAEHNLPADVTKNPEVVAIADGDYRLAPGALSLAVGSVAALDLVPAEFRDTDYLGNARTTDEVVFCGAVQSVLSDVGLVLAEDKSGSWQVNGETVPVSGSKFLPFAPYESVNVKLTPSVGSALVRYSVDGEVAWPKMDDSLWVHAPSNAVSVLAAITTDKVYWVDPNAGEGGDGSEASPFDTLYEIRRRIGSNATNYVVYVKAGDCNRKTQETEALGGSRFYVVNGYAGNARVKAVDGSAVTFISGAEATATTPACRCVYVGATAGCVAVQGFTLRQGRAATTNATTTVNLGGALMNATASVTSRGSAWLVDCVIDDCSAYAGSVSVGGTLVRCRVTGCVNPAASKDCAIFRSSKVVSSLVTGCGSPDTKGAPLFYQSEAYNVTTYSNEQWTSSLEMPVRNSVLALRIGGYVVRNANSDLKRSLYDDIHREGVTGEGCAQENPIRFNRAGEGDFRLKARSAGVSLGLASELKSAMDLYGNPYVIDVDGRCVVGCIAEIVPWKGLCITVR